MPNRRIKKTIAPIAENNAPATKAKKTKKATPAISTNLLKAVNDVRFSKLAFNSPLAVTVDFDAKLIHINQLHPVMGLQDWTISKLDSITELAEFIVDKLTKLHNTAKAKYAISGPTLITKVIALDAVRESHKVALAGSNHNLKTAEAFLEDVKAVDKANKAAIVDLNAEKDAINARLAELGA